MLSREHVLRAGPQCARIAKAAGVPLAPESEAKLRETLNIQVTVGLILKHSVQLPRDLALYILGRLPFSGCQKPEKPGHCC